MVNEPMASPSGMPISVPPRKPVKIRIMLTVTCSPSTPSRVSSTALTKTCQGGGNSTEFSSQAEAACQIRNRLAKPTR